MALTESSIRTTYDNLKSRAEQYLRKGNIHKALLYVHLASYTDHTFFLSFHDSGLEDILMTIADKIDRSAEKGFIPQNNKCVMIDSMSRYRGGLTVQYIKAIAAAGWDLMYVTCQDINSPQKKELNSFLNSITNITVVQVPKQLTGIHKLQYIYDAIMSYAPSKLYCHLNAYDAYLSTVSYALPQCISKYIINITDHASQLGFQSCQYSFEFRQLGCSISTKYRGIAVDHMFYLPFNPVLDSVPYKGLPAICRGKKIILSGGRYFKVMDADDTFFKLVKRLTDKHSDTVVVFPGSEDDSIIKNKIKSYGLNNKLILLGWRDDISELFRHADLFLNTYPHGGATMAQYAAHLKVPILSYRPIGECTNPVESFVCQDGYITVSSIGEDAFMEEADKLLGDKDYAAQKAADTYGCVMSIDKFNSYFKQMSESFVNIIPFTVDDSIDINVVQRKKLIAYQNATGEFQTRLVTLCGLNSVTMHISYLYPFIKNIIPKIVSTLLKRGFHFNRI